MEIDHNYETEDEEDEQQTVVFSSIREHSEESMKKTSEKIPLSPSERSLRTQLEFPPSMSWSLIKEVLPRCLHSAHSIEVLFAILVCTGARKGELFDPKIKFSVASPHDILTIGHHDITHLFQSTLFVQSGSFKNKHNTPIVRPCLGVDTAVELVHIIETFRKKTHLRSKMYTVPIFHETLQRLFPDFAPNQKDTYKFCRKLYANASYCMYQEVTKKLNVVLPDNNITLWIGSVLGHQKLSSSLHYQDVKVVDSSSVDPLGTAFLSPEKAEFSHQPPPPTPDTLIVGTVFPSVVFPSVVFPSVVIEAASHIVEIAKGPVHLPHLPQKQMTARMKFNSSSQRTKLLPLPSSSPKHHAKRTFDQVSPFFGFSSPPNTSKLEIVDLT